MSITADFEQEAEYILGRSPVHYRDNTERQPLTLAFTPMHSLEYLKSLLESALSNTENI